MKRPARKFVMPDNFDDLAEAVAAERDRPIARAYGKLFEFVNKAVTDPDFRHPDSRALLEFLLLVRDEMTDGINEKWCVDDIFEPMVTALHRHRGKQAKGKPKQSRKTPLRKGLEIMVNEGLDNNAILAELGNVDAMDRRRTHGLFPFEVCDPETSLREDGFLSYYVAGQSYETAVKVSVSDIQKLLSRIRNSPKAV